MTAAVVAIGAAVLLHGVLTACAAASAIAADRRGAPADADATPPSDEDRTEGGVR